MPLTMTMSDTARNVTSAELNRKTPRPIAQARPKATKESVSGRPIGSTKISRLVLKAAKTIHTIGSSTNSAVDGDEAVHREAENPEAEELRHHARREYLSCSRPRMTAMTAAHRDRVGVAHVAELEGLQVDVGAEHLASRCAGPPRVVT